MTFSSACRDVGEEAAIKTPLGVKKYALAVLFISLVGAALLYRVAPYTGGFSLEFLLILSVSFLFAHFPVRVSSDVIVILLSSFALAYIAIEGPWVGISAAVLGVALSSLVKRNSWEKFAFNTGLILLETVMVSFTWILLGRPDASHVTGELLVALAVVAVVDWAVNTSVFAGLIALLTSQKYWAQLSSLGRPALKHIAVDSVVAVLIVSINLSMGPTGPFLMAALLMLVRYGFQAYYELRASYEEVQTMLISILDARDAYTAGHSIRVAGYAVQLANELKLPPAQVENLRRAALLHDIGKVNVPDHVLKKPGRLSDEETAQMNQHPADGARFVEDVSSLRHLAPVIRHHHERLDGGGYPDGLNGEDIPFGARVLLVADAFDAMTTDRPYRKALTRAEALRRLAENAGTQFDPKVAWAAVRVFGADLPEYAEIREVFTQGQLEAAASRESILGKGRA